MRPIERTTLNKDRLRRGTKRRRASDYLRHPLLKELHSEIQAGVRRHGQLKSISLNITKVCNLRCQGCYFFGQGLDATPEGATDPDKVEAFIAAEKARGTNTITFVGGEPSLYLDRVRRFADDFQLYLVVNGLRPIPYEGFEDLNIGVSVWGDHEYDKRMRGGGKIDVFARALENFRGDPRVHFYFTVGSDNAHMIEPVVKEVVAEGHRVFFSFYGHVEVEAGERDAGFAEVRSEIERMTELYPAHVLTSSYLAKVGTTQELMGERWGYDQCPNISPVRPENAERIENGKPYNKHFRPFNTDLETTSLCCMGETLSCEDCYNIWPHTTWIMANQRKHMGSMEDFSNWLISSYVFYLLVRWVDWDRGLELMPEIHRFERSLRQGSLRQESSVPGSLETRIKEIHATREL